MSEPFKRAMNDISETLCSVYRVRPPPRTPAQTLSPRPPPRLVVRPTTHALISRTLDRRTRP